MLVHTRGFLLSKIKYGDTSLILKIFSQEIGLISVIKKGAFSSKSKNKLIFYPLAEIDFTFYKKEEQTLFSLREWEYKKIPKIGFEKSSVLLFLSEFISNVLAESDKNSEVYTFIENKLIDLEKTDAVGSFAIQFMAQLTQYLGFFPNFNQKELYFNLLTGTYQTQKSPHTLDSTINKQWESIFTNQALVISLSDRRKLMDELLRFYELQIDSFRKPKSLDIIKEVFMG